MARSDPSLECPRGLRRQAIVQSLLADVVHGRFRPGAHLVTQELAARFGVSHTPIREALMTLAGMGVIDLPPNCGAIVKRITPREVREICQVRRALECEAVRRACGRIDADELRVLESALQQMLTSRPRRAARFVEQARAADNRLHDLIADSSGNRFLANELNRLKTLFRAFRDVAWEHAEAQKNLDRLSEEAREHLAIIAALNAGDARKAAQAMARHIRSGAHYWSAAMPNLHSRQEGNQR
ncbi:MAG: GntR family transcriptional regulator [Gemmataceae bacterium]|nr:GntR family transcriptional regulator [Gemmataceae bacterium]